MKLDHTRTGRYSTYCLPRSKERGLIEAVGKPVVTAPLVILPRSKERGLIEAWGAKFRGPSNVRVLPRSKERGLIEATLELLYPHFSSTFRVQKNAASLKPLVCTQPVQPFDLLPRSKERGLIEARLHQSQAFEGLHSLPRSKERGLIEATL